MNIALICARSGSRGFPNKNNLVFDGKTLIQIAIDQAIKSNIFDKVAFSSDSDDYLNSISNQKFLVKIKRPIELSKSESSKWKVFRHAVEEIERKFPDNNVEYIADLDVTVPNRKFNHIYNSFDLLKKNKTCVIITAYKGERSPYFNIIEKKGNNWEVSKKINDLIIKNRQESPKTLFLSPSVFFFSKNTLFNTNHWSDSKIIPLVIPRIEGMDIDSKEDYEILTKIFDN